jgi:hypothetical protein
MATDACQRKHRLISVAGYVILLFVFFGVGLNVGNGRISLPGHKKGPSANLLIDLTTIASTKSINP